MNLLLLARVAALGAVLSHAPGAASAETEKARPMLSLTEADNDRTVDIRAGETVQLTLPENATTGYRWAVDRLDADVIEALASEPNYPGGVGAGGHAAFSFKAKKAGSGEIALKYWRHWEGDASVAKRFRVRLTVKP